MVVSELDPAFIMYTSGTTGRPKRAGLSHFNLLMNTYHMLGYMGISGSDEVWLSGLPLFHIGGLNGILPYLLLGGTTVMLPSGQFDAREVVDALERERVTGCLLRAHPVAADLRRAGYQGPGAGSAAHLLEGLGGSSVCAAGDGGDLSRRGELQRVRPDGDELGHLCSARG